MDFLPEATRKIEVPKLPRLAKNQSLLKRVIATGRFPIEGIWNLAFVVAGAR